MKLILGAFIFMWVALVPFAEVAQANVKVKDSCVTIDGEITSLSDNQITIKDYHSAAVLEVIVSEEILDHRRNRSLAPGQVARIKGCLNGDGNIEASEVKVRRPITIRHKDRAALNEAKIIAMQDSMIQVEALNMTFDFCLSRGTKIKNTDGRALEPGDIVRIRGEIRLNDRNCYHADIVKLIEKSSTNSIQAGDQIGNVGSSGFSTGPHLFLQITVDSSPIDPVQVSGQLINNYIWPLPNSDWTAITLGYGCVAPPGWFITLCNNGLNSFHTGLSITGWYGDPVVAIADGEEIFRGVLGGYGNTVVLDHGNNIFSLYGHLLE